MVINMVIITAMAMATIKKPKRELLVFFELMKQKNTPQVPSRGQSTKAT